MSIEGQADPVTPPGRDRVREDPVQIRTNDQTARGPPTSQRPVPCRPMERGFPVQVSLLAGAGMRDPVVADPTLLLYQSYAKVNVTCAGSPTMRLEDKVAIITGGGSGIGRATAERFAEEGARLVIADYRADTGEAAVDAINDAGGEAVFVLTDVSDAARVGAMVDRAVDAFGGIDILFNGAGVLTFGTVLDTDEDDWNWVIAINLTGTFLCCRAVLPHMIAAGGGSIINLSSSTGAHDAGGNTAAYVASKGGVAMLTKAMAVDHAKAGIRVNALCPGPTDTPMLRDNLPDDVVRDFVAASMPMNRLGLPVELANAALFLASDEASFVTGTMLAVDGGQTAAV